MSKRLTADQLAKVRDIEGGAKLEPKKRKASHKRKSKRKPHKKPRKRTKNKVPKRSSSSRSKRSRQRRKTTSKRKHSDKSIKKSRSRSNKKSPSTKRSQNLKYVHRFRSNRSRTKHKKYGYAYNFRSEIPGFETSPLRKMMHPVKIRNYKDPVSSKVNNQITYCRNEAHEKYNHGEKRPTFSRSRYRVDGPLWEAVRNKLISKYNLYNKGGSDQTKNLTITDLIQFAGASLLSPKEERAVIDATPDRGDVLHKIEYEKRESKQSADVSQKLDDVFDRLADQNTMSYNNHRSDQHHYALIRKVLFALISMMVYMFKQELGGSLSDNSIRSAMYNSKNGSTNRVFVDALTIGEYILKAYNTRKRSK